MSLSFREKSLWLMLVSLVLVFAAYFASVLPAHGADMQVGQVVRFAAMIAWLVVLQVIGHVVIAIAARRQLAQGVREDERDRRIGLEGTRNGAWVLSTGIVAAMATALLIPGNFAFMHVLLAFWVLAQLVETATQLVLYRRGA